jgi:hypothetical protein
MPARTWIVRTLLVLGGALFALVCIEGAVGLALSHPRVLAWRDGTVGRALAHARGYYVDQDRKIVQYMPECSRYDPEVTYTLIPGAKCRVANREHVVEYAANRAGLRDSDEALSNPPIVVIGDSHAMGWGVRSEEAFPKRLQGILSRPVLNTGMSSFGTVREFALLERLRLPSAKTLVIQYSDNDFLENKPYIDDGALEILPEWQYRAVVEAHRRWTRYYPFKHVIGGILSVAHPVIPERLLGSPPPGDVVREARYFLEVLLRHRATLEGKTVVVLEISSYGRMDGRFVAAVRHLLSEPRYSPLAEWVRTLDVASALGPGDYYLLDDHMRASGHEKVAQLLAAELKRGKAGTP